MQTEKKIKVSIPAGIDSSPDVRIRTRRTGSKRRIAREIFLPVNVSGASVVKTTRYLYFLYVDFICGSARRDIRIPTVDGDVMIYNVKPGTKTDTKVLVKEKEFPSLRNPRTEEIIM